MLGNRWRRVRGHGRLRAVSCRPSRVSSDRCGHHQADRERPAGHLAHGAVADGRSVSGVLAFGRGFPDKVWLVNYPSQDHATIVLRNAEGHVLPASPRSIRLRRSRAAAASSCSTTRPARFAYGGHDDGVPAGRAPVIGVRPGPRRLIRPTVAISSFPRLARRSGVRQPRLRGSVGHAARRPFRPRSRRASRRPRWPGRPGTRRTAAAGYHRRTRDVRLAAPHACGDGARRCRAAGRSPS